ncbi:MAG: hypothetical protein HQM12_08345 [SAR324 cluster bacterium]|nr:hypothetical protein [SAR324 cluster bacterium]
MKYRVYVKEIWVQPYIVEANSKAHAKRLLENLEARQNPQIKKDTTRPQYWGIIGSEKWDVEEV